MSQYVGFFLGLACSETIDIFGVGIRLHLIDVYVERWHNVCEGCHPIVLFITEIKSECVQTKLNFIYCAELHVSTYFRSSSGSQFVFKTY